MGMVTFRQYESQQPQNRSQIIMYFQGDHLSNKLKKLPSQFLLLFLRGKGVCVGGGGGEQPWRGEILMIWKMRVFDNLLLQGRHTLIQFQTDGAT